MEDNNYNNEMIAAFIDKEEKSLWYQLAFEKFNINGVDTMQWNWSWWAFGGGFLYLLFRKQYIASFVLFIISMTLGMIPFVGFGLAILSGGYASYFVYKGYKSKRAEVESHVQDTQMRIDTMRQVGGYHQWVVWVYALFVTFAMFGFVAMILIPSMAFAS
ncbi:DUF2628 domain-containing protein [Sulfurimonas sp. SAG-AH-194-I05]|nr:hypothetical protein [Sulfurimonas sp. SAG-AH-194-I05]MDF1874353.1 DUF2628 domain-containing protein [Sulfurimonas sp. SAG-AH-194-I05]